MAAYATAERTTRSAQLNLVVNRRPDEPSAPSTGRGRSRPRLAPRPTGGACRRAPGGSDPGRGCMAGHVRSRCLPGRALRHRPEAGRRADRAERAKRTGLQALLPTERPRRVALLGSTSCPHRFRRAVMSESQTQRRVRVERNIYRRPSGVLEAVKAGRKLTPWRRSKSDPPRGFVVVCWLVDVSVSELVSGPRVGEATGGGWAP